jgi:hypothetical protein
VRRNHRTALAAGLLAMVCVLLNGCINVVPLPRTTSEVTDAKKLAKILKRLAPEAKEVLLQERDVANQIKITLEETAQAEPVAFREKLRGYQSEMISVRNRRHDLVTAIGQGLYQSPLVYAVQQDAMRMLRDEITRTEVWIQSSHNVQLRADLGQTKEFPELGSLNKQLAGFLAQVVNDPLLDQVRYLVQEYRFDVGE